MVSWFWRYYFDIFLLEIHKFNSEDIQIEMCVSDSFSGVAFDLKR